MSRCSFLSTTFVLGSLSEVLPSTSSAKNVSVQRPVELIPGHSAGWGSVAAWNDPHHISDLTHKALLTIDKVIHGHVHSPVLGEGRDLADLHRPVHSAQVTSNLFDSGNVKISFFYLLNPTCS